jgi:hypothetical protein
VGGVLRRGRAGRAGSRIAARTSIGTSSTNRERPRRRAQLAQSPRSCGPGFSAKTPASPLEEKSRGACGWPDTRRRASGRSCRSSSRAGATGRVGRCFPRRSWSGPTPSPARNYCCFRPHSSAWLPRTRHLRDARIRESDRPDVPRAGDAFGDKSARRAGRATAMPPTRSLAPPGRPPSERAIFRSPDQADRERGGRTLRPVGSRLLVRSCTYLSPVVTRVDGVVVLPVRMLGR